MASFNQSPLGQTSLALQIFNLALGNNTAAAGISTNNETVVHDGSLGGPTFVIPASVVRPSWRRESKIVSANQ